eukprot:TRINITY_DN13881_c0_g1_i1.p2 TRINITY_DN13881_c0_g1~~TRINITY_DN13881_c0_g1_i1.p2  ORF type:complete len:274 (-),score=38.52 TRINITY_DN13881_c0_g1_i1:997-1818(-)
MHRLDPAYRLLLHRNLTLKSYSKPFEDSLIKELFNFSVKLTGEREVAFIEHCATVKHIHVFKRCSDEIICGFQMWCESLTKGNYSVIRGGKLRFSPEVSGMALPQISGLVFLCNEMQGEKCKTRFFRVSIASVFGFNALHSQLSSSFIISQSHLGGRCDFDLKLKNFLFECTRDFATHNGFIYDEYYGLVDVGFKLLPSVLARADSEFLQRPSVRLYSSLVPDWKNDSKFIAWGWEMNEANFESQIFYIKSKSNKSSTYSDSPKSGFPMGANE